MNVSVACVRSCARGALWLALPLLAACGGGLGSDDEIGIDGISVSSSSVDCNVAAYATASVSYSGEIEASDVTYSWSQTSGTSVTLSGASAAKVYFTAPASAGTVVLALTVSAAGLSDTASVSFSVSGASCS